jgi:hypothetical protein
MVYLFITSPRRPNGGTTEGENMYIVALFIVMAILLEAIMTVLNSILAAIGLGDTVKNLPIIGTNLILIVSILMVWLLGDNGLLLAGWGLYDDDNWINIVANGAIIAGMIPLKDAVFGAILKGLRA